MVELSLDSPVDPNGGSFCRPTTFDIVINCCVGNGKPTPTVSTLMGILGSMELQSSLLAVRFPVRTEFIPSGLAVIRVSSGVYVTFAMDCVDEDDLGFLASKPQSGMTCEIVRAIRQFFNGENQEP